jgi:hypothetical protein
MSSNICVDRVVVIIIVVGLVALFAYSYKELNEKKVCKPCEPCKINQPPPTSEALTSQVVRKKIIVDDRPRNIPINQRSVLMNDYNVVYDPMTMPMKRDALYNIPQVVNAGFANMINIPTNYYYDSPSIVGYVTNENNNHDKYQLYGYKDPQNRYKTNYYAYDTNTFELFDKDKIIVDNHEFIVNMYPDDFYKYNPTLI